MLWYNYQKLSPQSTSLAALPPPLPPTQPGSSAHDTWDSDVEVAGDISKLQEVEFRGRPTAHPTENLILEQVKIQILIFESFSFPFIDTILTLIFF